MATQNEFPSAVLDLCVVCADVENIVGIGISDSTRCVGGLELKFAFAKVVSPTRFGKLGWLVGGMLRSQHVSGKYS